MISRWAKIKENLTWPISIIVFLFITAIGLVIYDKLPLEWPIRSAEVERNVRKWTEDAGYSVKKIPDDKSRFHFTAITPNGTQVDLINEKKQSPLIISIGMVLNLPKEAEKILNQMSEKERRQFLATIKLELLRIGIQYQLNLDESCTRLNSIRFENVLFYTSSNSKAEFYNEIFLVVRATGLLSTLFEREL